MTLKTIAGSKLQPEMGGTATGRHIILLWGKDTLDFGDLNTDAASSLYLKEVVRDCIYEYEYAYK